MSFQNCRSLLRLRLLSIPCCRSLATAASTASASHPHQLSSFTVNFLTTSCGLTPTQALSAARTIRLDENTRRKPETVLALFRSHGFSDAQITEIVARSPRLLFRTPEKLVPLLQFLTHSDFPLEFIVREPNVLLRSLDGNIRQRVQFLRRFLVNPEDVRSMCRRFSWCLTYSLEDTMIPNVGLLLELGVSETAIARLMVSYTRTLAPLHERFAEVVQVVQDWGVKPHCKIFPHAVRAMCALGIPSLDARLKLFKKLGWSEEDIRSAFRRSPMYIVVSEQKIMRMNSFARKLGLGPAVLSRQPILLMYSFDKRILPRYAVWQVLTTKGLIERSTSTLISIFSEPEKRFMHRFLSGYVDEVPELMDVYLGKIKIEDLGCSGDESSK